MGEFVGCPLAERAHHAGGTRSWRRRARSSGPSCGSIGHLRAGKGEDLRAKSEGRGTESMGIWGEAILAVYTKDL